MSLECESARIIAIPTGPTLSPAGNLTPYVNASPVLKDDRVSMPHRSANEPLLASILELTEDAVLSVARDGTIETWSPGAERLYGYTAQEIIGQHLRRVVPLYEWQALEAALSQTSHGDSRCCEKTERLRKDGSRILLKVRRTFIRREDGEIEGILESGRAINSSGVEASEGDLSRLFLEQMPIILWTADLNLRITSNWGAGWPSLKIRPGELVGRTVYEFLGCVERNAPPIAEHYEALRGVSSNIEYKRKDRILEIRLEPLREASGAIVGCVGVGTDITGRKKSEEELHYQSRHDALTDLVNYREFIEKLEREVDRAERSHRSFTLLLLDLDGLKRINDLRGHLAGNRALKRLAAVIKEHCRSTDVAARYGGDEFAVMLIDSDHGMADQVAQRIESSLREGREEPPLTVSIGIGIYPDDGRTAADLIGAADRQLYRRKKDAKSNVSPAIGEIMQSKIAGR